MACKAAAQKSHLAGNAELSRDFIALVLPITISHTICYLSK